MNPYVTALTCTSSDYCLIINNNDLCCDCGLFRLFKIGQYDVGKKTIEKW